MKSSCYSCYCYTSTCLLTERRLLAKEYEKWRTAHKAAEKDLKAAKAAHAQEMAALDNEVPLRLIGLHFR